MSSDDIDRQEFRRAATDVGLAALRVVLLINGGGAIALLAFLGSALTAGTFEALAHSASVSLAVFCLGLSFAAATAFCGWRSQDNLAQGEPHIARGNAWLTAAGCLFLASLACFLVGALHFAWALAPLT